MTADVEDRCPLTELPKAGCAHCRGHLSRPGQLDDLTPADIGPRFIARYSGTCGHCGGPIEVDDTIAALENDHGFACDRCLP